jgi:hypothetical protein
MGDKPPGTPVVGIQLNINAQAFAQQKRATFQEMHDALLVTCLQAEAGDAGARQELGNFLKLLRRAETAQAGLSSADGLQLIR